MNRLKSMFVTPFIVLNLVALVYASFRVLDGQGAWAFVFLMTVPLSVLTVGNAFLHWFSTTKRSLPIPTTLLVLGDLGAAASFFWSGFDVVLAGTAVVLTTGYGLYVVWYSSYGRNRQARIVKGRPLPDWTALDLDARPVKGSDLAGRGALVVFYRGNWCPFCVVQVQKVAEHYRKLDEAGFRVVFVSPQSQDETRKLAQKFDVPMTFWVDEGNRAAEALGIVDRNGLPLGIPSGSSDRDTVQAVSILLDPEGRVIYADLTESYRVRPTPEDYLAEIERWKTRSAA